MSTYLDFTNKVRQYIIDKYDRKYLGTLTYTITPITNTVNLYTLSWGLNQETYPFIMQGEFLTEDKFFCYIVKQIDITKFFNTKHWIAYRIGKPAFEVEDYIDPLLKFNKYASNII
jgi:hypothetical protein